VIRATSLLKHGFLVHISDRSNAEITHSTPSYSDQDQDQDQLSNSKNA